MEPIGDSPCDFRITLAVELFKDYKLMCHKTEPLLIGINDKGDIRLIQYNKMHSYYKDAQIILSPVSATLIYSRFHTYFLYTDCYRFGPNTQMEVLKNEISYFIDDNDKNILVESTAKFIKRDYYDGIDFLDLNLNIIYKCKLENLGTVVPIYTTYDVNGFTIIYYNKYIVEGIYTECDDRRLYSQKTGKYYYYVKFYNRAYLMNQTERILLDLFEDCAINHDPNKLVIIGHEGEKIEDIRLYKGYYFIRPSKKHLYKSATTISAGSKTKAALHTYID